MYKKFSFQGDLQLKVIQEICWYIEHHKMDGRDGNGKPTSFTPEEAEKLKGALLDLSDRIRRAADTI